MIMMNNNMLAAYCCGYNNNQKNQRPLIAKHELRSCPRPSLRSHPLHSSTNNTSYCYPPGTVLIQTIAASICGSDLFGLGGCSSSPAWRRPTNLLVAMQEKCGGSGHEAIGRIIDLVPHNTTPLSRSTPSSPQFFIGQKVLAMPSSYLYKVASMRNMFEKVTGTNLKEYFITHSCVCLPLPESVPRDDFDHRWYVIAQPLGTILHACQKLGSVINLNIAVVGQGQNGLIMSQMLANMGARRIIALDFLNERLVYSKKNKATHTIRVNAPMEDIDAVRKEIQQITDGEMCDIAIDMVGHQSKTITLCSQLAKKGGRVLLFGLPPAQDEAQMSISYEYLTRNLSYICAHSPEFESFCLALELIEQGRFDPSTIFSHVMPFCEFTEAYEKACNYRDGLVKVLLTFPT